MAGSDQSVNLGGMLNQIGTTVGGMGEAYKPVSQALSKPRGDMSDPNHLQRLAQWASSNGDAAAANMYMSQAREASALQRREQEQAKAEMKSKAANAATFQYKTALESGKQEDIEKAEEALLANAMAHDYDGMARMSAASTQVRAQQDQQWQAEERERVNKERIANEQFMAKMNATEDAEAIQKIVEGAPAETQAVAQRAATQRLSYLEGVEQRRAREAENLQVVEADISIPTDEAILPKELQEVYSAEVERLQKDVEAARNGDGTWEPSVRRGLQARRDRLAAKISEAAARNVLNQASEERSVQRQWDDRMAKVATDLPTKAEAEEIEKDLISDKGLDDDWTPFNESVSNEDVIAEFRRRQRESLEEARPGGEATAEEPKDQVDESRGAKVGESRADKNGVTWTWDGTKWSR